MILIGDYSYEPACDGLPRTKRECQSALAVHMRSTHALVPSVDAAAPISASLKGPIASCQQSRFGRMHGQMHISSSLNQPSGAGATPPLEAYRPIIISQPSCQIDIRMYRYGRRPAHQGLLLPAES
jgi:hypothetical protein